MNNLPLQNTSEWLEWRKGKIGASMVPIIMGESPYTTPLELWKRTLGFSKDLQQHAGMRYGHEMESEVRGMANVKYNTHFEPLVIQHPNHAWAIASLDGISECGRFIIEIKCCNEKDHKIAKKGKIPPKYNPQVHWQILIAKAANPEFESHYYVSFHKGEMVSFESTYDEKYAEKCFHECEHFHGLLESYTPPPHCERDYFKIEDEEFGKIAIQWMSAKNTLEEAKKQEKYFRDQLVDFTDDGNCEGFGVRMTRVKRAGTIDTEKLYQDYGIEEEDLSKYRKDQIGFWKVSIIE